MNQYDLYHTGVKRRSGRYPWGSGARPYQSMEGRSSRKSISSFIRDQRSKKQQAAIEKMRENAKQKAMAEAEAKRQHDADKERVVREGRASEVLKYQGELTNDQLREIRDRIKLENELRSLSDKEYESTMDKINDFSKGLKLSAELIKNGADLWNGLAGIWNATEDGKKDPLTKIDTGSGGKNK